MLWCCLHRVMHRAVTTVTHTRNRKCANRNADTQRNQQDRMHPERASVLTVYKHARRDSCVRGTEWGLPSSLHSVSFIFNKDHSLYIARDSRTNHFGKMKQPLHVDGSEFLIMSEKYLKYLIGLLPLLSTLANMLCFLYIKILAVT